MQTLEVKLQPSYQVNIGLNFVTSAEILAEYPMGTKRPVIVTDSNVKALYANGIANSFTGLNPVILSFPAGEASKSRETKAFLEDEMLQAGCNRDTVLFALGGGVVCDITGFLAATYCRGVHVVYVPTTLLAMVDASVGGKTAVNTPYGKNMIGSFHQPSRVFMDLNFLRTLPAEELNNGLAEMLKHTLIAAPEQFEELQQRYKKTQGEHWLLSDVAWLEDMLCRNVAIKKHFVELDEKDNGARQLLNFGHTMGHAVEQLSNYRVAHGHAVVVGLLIESYLSYLLGYLSLNDFSRIEQSLAICDFPLYLPYLANADEVIEVLHLDKKARSQELYCVLLQGVGMPVGFTQPVSIEAVKKALDWYNNRCGQCS